MPVIKVWCLPKSTEEKLKALFDSIIEGAVSIKDLGFKGEEDNTVLFPVDMMSYGLGIDIIIEAGSQAFMRCSQATRDRFAEAMVTAVSRHFPEAKVECFAYPYYVGTTCGFAASKPKEDV